MKHYHDHRDGYETVLAVVILVVVPLLLVIGTVRLVWP